MFLKDSIDLLCFGTVHLLCLLEENTNKRKEKNGITYGTFPFVYKCLDFPFYCNHLSSHSVN